MSLLDWFKGGTKAGTSVNDLNVYEFMRHADCGTGFFQDMSVLTNHTRERDFDERKNYSFYLNFTKLIISRLTEPVFKDMPVRKESTGNELFENFLKSCNKKGQSFNHVMRMNARKIRRNSVYFCVVDNDADLPKTTKEAIENRKFPYIYWRSPEFVTDYSWDYDNTLESITFKEFDHYNEKGESVFYYREWTKYGWTQYEDIKKKKAVESGLISIGVIPVIPVYDIEPDDEIDPVMVQPELYHTARTILAVMNQCSELRELQRNQGFSLIKYPITSKSEDYLKQSTDIGTKNALTYDAESSHEPGYMSPDADIPRSIMEDRNFLIQMVFELGRIVGLVSVVKEESGRAKEWDFQATKETLSHFKTVMENAEKKIVEVVGKYLNVNLDYEVNYSDQFGLVDIDAESDRLDKDLQHNLGPKFNLEVKKQYASERLKDSPADVLEEILKDIENQDEDEVESGNDGL